jgi:hypothetical protein
VDFFDPSNVDTVTLPEHEQFGPSRPHNPTPPRVNLDGSHTEWLVDGRLPRVGTSLLIGHRRSGKSTLARDLALSIARGAPWLGFDTRRGRALYVHASKDLRQVCAAFVAGGLRSDDEVHMLAAQPVGDLLSQVRERAQSLRPSLIVLDGVKPLLRPHEPESAWPGAGALAQLAWIAMYTRSHVLLVHELSGSSDQDMKPLLRGDDGVDTVLVLHRAGAHRFVGSIQRHGHDLLEPVQVPHAPSFGSARRTLRDPQVAERLLSYLRFRSSLVSDHEICGDLSDEDPTTLRRVLEGLRQSGRLIRTGSGGEGDPYRYTGFDRVVSSSDNGWLRRVRPWARLRTWN